MRPEVLHFHPQACVGGSSGRGRGRPPAASAGCTLSPAPALFLRCCASRRGAPAEGSWVLAPSARPTAPTAPPDPRLCGGHLPPPPPAPWTWPLGAGSPFSKPQGSFSPSGLLSCPPLGPFETTWLGSGGQAAGGGGGETGGLWLLLHMRQDKSLTLYRRKVWRDWGRGNPRPSSGGFCCCHFGGRGGSPPRCLGRRRPLFNGPCGRALSWEFAGRI